MISIDCWARVRHCFLGTRWFSQLSLRLMAIRRTRPLIFSSHSQTLSQVSRHCCFLSDRYIVFHRLKSRKTPSKGFLKTHKLQGCVTQWEHSLQKASARGCVFLQLDENQSHVAPYREHSRWEVCSQDTFCCAGLFLCVCLDHVCTLNFILLFLLWWWRSICFSHLYSLPTVRSDFWEEIQASLSNE